jgi:hypothetical protein
MLADREVHHAAPRCLLKLREEAENGAGVEAWLSWEEEARRWSVPVEISRRDLARLIERSAVLLDRNKHRLIHESDWQRWGRRGGRETVRRYGTEWMALLALRRWGRISPADLDAARPLR